MFFVLFTVVKKQCLNIEGFLSHLIKLMLNAIAYTHR